MNVTENGHIADKVVLKERQTEERMAEQNVEGTGRKSCLGNGNLRNRETGQRDLKH